MVGAVTTLLAHASGDAAPSTPTRLSVCVGANQGGGEQSKYERPLFGREERLALLGALLSSLSSLNLQRLHASARGL